MSVGPTSAYLSFGNSGNEQLSAPPASTQCTRRVQESSFITSGPRGQFSEQVPGSGNMMDHDDMRETTPQGMDAERRPGLGCADATAGTWNDLWHGLIMLA